LVIDKLESPIIGRSYGWRAIAILADIGRASLVGRTPRNHLGLCQEEEDNKKRARLVASEISSTNRNTIGSSNRIRLVLMRYSLHEMDTHDVVATATAADRDEALEWFSEKLRMMLTFEGDPASAEYLLDEWAEGLLAHVPNPTIPVFVVTAVVAYPQASQGAGL
jgi:hypothetical protein